LKNIFSKNDQKVEMLQYRISKKWSLESNRDVIDLFFLLFFWSPPKEDFSESFKFRIGKKLEIF
jgi:hypothetical protein